MGNVSHLVTRTAALQSSTEDGLTEGMPAKDRQFVTLYFQDGLSPEHVAERLGISVKTVYSKKHKIQRKLSEIVGAPAEVA